MAQAEGQVEVEVTLKEDDLKAGLNKMEESIRKVAEKGETIFSKFGESIRNVSERLREMGSEMVDAAKTGLSSLGESIRQVTTTGINVFSRFGESVRNASERFRDMGNEMVDTADNLTQAISLPFTLLSAAMLEALKNTKSGKAAYDEYDKAVKKVQAALVPLAKTVLDIGLKYLPPLIDGIKQATQWFQNLSPQVQKMIVAIGGLSVVVGPVIAFVGALILGLGSLATTFGTLLTPLGLLSVGFGALVAHAIQASGGIVKFGQTLLNLGRYFAVVVEDSDVLNDWLTHLPKEARGAARDVAQAFVNMRWRIHDAIYGLKKDIAPQFSGILKKLADSVKQGNPQQIGTALAELINKGVQVLPQLLGKINWNGLAKAIVKGINNMTVGLKAFVGTVNWGAIIDLISKGIESSIKFVGKLIPPLTHLITEVLKTIPWEQIANHMASSAGRISNAFLTVLDSAVKNINYGQLVLIALDFIDKFIEALFDLNLWNQIVSKHWDLLLGIIFSPERLAGGIFKAIEKIPFGKVVTSMLKPLYNLTGPLREKIGKILGDWFGKAKEYILGKLGDLGSKLKTKINNALVQALGGHDGKWSTVVQHWKTTALNKLSDWGSQLKTKISSGISRGISGFESKFSNMASKWKDNLLKPFRNLNFRSLVQRAIDAIKNIRIPHIPLPHFYKTGSIKIGPVDLPTFGVKWYATGGVFTGPSVIGVGEAGPEAVVPLSGSRMRPFAQAIAKELGGIGGHNITVNNYTNDKRVGYDIARAIQREMWKHAK